MSEEREPFLERWSRLKTEVREAPNVEEKPAQPAPPATAEENQPPALPPVEQLTPESDFAPFMSAKVDEDTRRAALKKLFSDARFNVPDPYEAYSGDWTGGEPIPMEMLKTLNQARKLIFDETEKTAQAGAEKAARADTGKPEPTPQESKDGAGRQDA